MSMCERVKRLGGRCARQFDRGCGVEGIYEELIVKGSGRLRGRAFVDRRVYAGG